MTSRRLASIAAAGLLAALLAPHPLARAQAAGSGLPRGPRHHRPLADRPAPFPGPFADRPLSDRPLADRPRAVDAQPDGAGPRPGPSPSPDLVAADPAAGASPAMEDAGRVAPSPGDAPAQVPSSELPSTASLPADPEVAGGTSAVPLFSGDTEPAPAATDAAAADATAAEPDPLEPWRRREVAATDPGVFAPARSPEERLAHSQRFEPAPLTPPSDAILPVGARRYWLARLAALRAALADFDGARDTWERSIGLGLDDVAAWQGLARARVYSGEFEAAESAWLAAALRAEQAPAENHARRAGIERELGELYLVMDFPADSLAALERSVQIDPDAARTRELLAFVRSELDPAAPGAMRRPELFPPPAAQHWRNRAEAAVTAFASHTPAPLRQLAARIAGGLDAPRAGALAAGLVLLGLAARRLRRSGDLVVRIDYPEALDGSFSVRLASRPGRHKRLTPDEYQQSSRRSSTRSSHQRVGRETQFNGLRPGRHHVTLQGLLKDPDGGEILTQPFEERTVTVRAGETARIDFDVRPRECPIDVCVRWDQRRAGDVGVMARGLPQSLRYATQGELRLRLARGSHTLVIGSGDRVAERDLEVESYQPTRVDVDLGGSEPLVFKGCPPAVEPYLRGDLGGAARALERDGQTSVAHLLLARLHQEQGHTERAAEQLESAGHVLEAAKLRESISDFARAAALFENSGNLLRAADTWRQAGEWAKAGRLFEQAADYAKAVDCYRRAGDDEGLIGALERQGAHFEAAQLALTSGDRARAIRLLQQIHTSHAAYPQACEQLAEAFEHEGHSDLAAHKLEELIRVTAPGRVAADTYSRLAELLEHAEENERALEVLEDLRRREPTYPHVASRIEGLRKKRSNRRLSESGGAAAMPTAFHAEQRYEILEEIGRGGMGLVFKARDRRLDRIVALKRLPESLRDHPKALRLFLNEAQAAARLNHPNIVTVYDTDQENGTFFITMELLEGQPLNVILHRRGRLGPRDSARIALQVAQGLHYAHERHVVHRDIKTANLFLTTDRTLKIMDFGLAKMIAEVRRGSTVIGGTPFYMAPEQAAGDDVDHRADIYSLGITLFELVTGHVPFPTGDVAYHHRHTPPPDPRSQVEGLPDRLADLILDMIRKQPSERCASAAEVARRLEPVIAAAG